MKKIYLNQYSPPRGPIVYFVTKLINDVRYKIGQSIDHADVEGLCALSEHWTVVITSED